VLFALVVTGVAAVIGAVGFGGLTVINALAAGLPDPAGLEHLTFAQPTIVYDRTGTVELARFQAEGRRVVTFDEVPGIVLDATTTAEDRTFWENDGFDPFAIVSAAAGNVGKGTERGASTITQQLVRARLLPPEVTAPGADRYARKILEVIQSARVTGAFPGESGKKRIMTAYLNQIFYGHGAYGIAAAAAVYFGVSDLGKLTPAQAAQLAALPKAPSIYDLYQYAKQDADGRLVVDPESPPVMRRNWVLQNLVAIRGEPLSPDALQRALAEPVVLANLPAPRMRAGHFSWQVRKQLEAILGSADAVDTGGYKVITTLDWTAQQQAERWMTAAAIVPNLDVAAGNRLLDAWKIPASDRGWIAALRGKDLHDGALVALDYRTGDVLAYMGSAGYDQDKMTSPQFSPKFDAAGTGGRQPGSAFKPVLYSAAFEAGVLTPGSLLLDITTKFDVASGWTPKDADERERGPVLVRNALQMSLNIPAIRAYQRVGGPAVADMAAAMGLRFQGGRDALLQAGLAAAIGTVEVRPLDLVSAYGTIANGGVSVPPRMILSIAGPDGKAVYTAPKIKTRTAMSTATAFQVTDILAGNTDPKQNPIWSKVLELRNGPRGEHRVAAVKTGTANEAKDLATYGFLAPPADPAAPALAVGIWMGNSDHSTPKARKPATSLTAPAPLWHAFVRDLTADQPLATFTPPKDVVLSTIDAWTGGAIGRWTRERKKEWFRIGTEPGARTPVDVPGLLYARACGGWRVDPRKAELGPARWLPDVENWLARARRGVNVRGPYGTRTAYFWDRVGWGGPLLGSTCNPAGKGPGHDGHGHDKNGDPGASPSPAPAADTTQATAAPAPAPTPLPQPSPTPAPTAAPRNPYRKRRNL
jgi:penicillin-binding protein 1A